MTRTTTMADRLRATLQAEAEQIHVPSNPARLDPVRGTPLRAELDPPGPASRRRGLVLAAAAVVVVLGAGAALVLRHDPAPATGDLSTDDGSTPTPAAADGTLAPAWVPDGLTLWSVSWRQTVSNGGNDLGIVQLFGRDGSTENGAIHVWIQPGGTGFAPGDPVTVRGQAGTVSPAKEFPETTSEIFWNEPGASVGASFVGMSLEEAVAVLEGLTWRSDDRLEGFAPPSGGDMTMLGESSSTSVGATFKSAEFYYLDSALNMTPGQGLQLSVRTSTGEGGSDMSFGYLQTWFHGTVGVDGVIESHDPQFGTLRRDWPDGQSLYIDANATPIDRPTLEQIADQIAPVTGADLVSLRAALTARIVEQEVVASASTSAGTLEVHGSGPMAALCLRPADGADPLCPNPTGSSDGQGTFTASLLVGDTWYVAGAATGLQPRIAEQEAATPSPTDPDPSGLSPETASDGDWQFVLLAVPDGIDQLAVWFGDAGSGVSRPSE